MKNLKLLVSVTLLSVSIIIACGESSTDESSTNEDGIVTSRIIN